MALLEWHTNTSGRYISGVSHGVFYGDDGVPIPWNGLINVTEKFQTNEPTPVYNSLGQKYDLHGNVAEKRHSIVCYTYPEEMDEYLGTEYVEEFGFAVDERPPRKFNMAYRSDCDGYYELHVLLDQIATFGDKTHSTDSSTPGISNITMNLQGVPHEVFGSSHLIFDSRNPITASAERLLYGTRNTDGNFNHFMRAEVDWIAQAVNYAPCLMPDYEVPVMLETPSGTIQVPGVKGTSKWNLHNTVVYWDEVNDKPAIQSKAPDGQMAAVGIPLDIDTPVTLRTQITLQLRDPILNNGVSVNTYGVGISESFYTPNNTPNNAPTNDIAQVTTESGYEARDQFREDLTDGNVRLIGGHPDVDNTNMIAGSDLTHESFYTPNNAPHNDIVQITLGGFAARNELRAALADRGLNYQTVTEIPFDIELIGAGQAEAMFRDCAALTSIPQMDTSNVTSMHTMFLGCSSLTSVPQMDTSSVTMMYGMFRDCSSLAYVPDMDTSSVTNMSGMFQGCAALTDGNVRLIGRHPDVNTAGMILDSGLTREPFYELEQITLGSGTQARDQFRAALSDRGLNYETVTEVPFLIELVGTGSVSYMFQDCRSLTSVPEMDTSSVTNMEYMFLNCSSLTSIPQMDITRVRSMLYMFQGCTSLTSVPEMDTSSVTNMWGMFYGCSSLTSIPQMDTSSVITMWGMFYGCSSLTSIPQMDTSRVTNMWGMFRECTSLTSVPEMDTSRVTNMVTLFSSCSSLTSVPQMDTSSVTDMQSMFYECSSLTSVPQMDTSRVTNMLAMFYNCSSITSVPEMDTSSVTDMTIMFRNCSELTDGNVRLIGRHPDVDTNNMIQGSGLTREPVFDVAALKELYIPQRLGLFSNVSGDPMLMIYHGGLEGSSDLLFEEIMVTPQTFFDGFFDRNTVPKTRSERYRLVEGSDFCYVVYEHLRFNLRDEVDISLINPYVYELTADGRLLQSSGDEFTFTGPQATSLEDDKFEIDDTILGF